MRFMFYCPLYRDLRDGLLCKVSDLDVFSSEGRLSDVLKSGVCETPGNEGRILL